MVYRWVKALSRVVGGARRKPDNRQCAAAHACGFDAQWYLAAYPDIAAAGIDPWEHYQRYGKQEGRLAHRNQALAWEHALWRGAHNVIQPRLERLLIDPTANPRERLSARWALAQWYGWQNQWPAAREVLAPEGELLAYAEPTPALLMVDIACRHLVDHSTPALAKQALAFLQARFPDHPDTTLAEANVAMLTQGDSTSRFNLINRYFEAHGLTPVTLADPTKPLGLDNLATAQAHPMFNRTTKFTPNPSRLKTHHSRLTIHDSRLTIHNPPLISVIIPLYNAQHTVATALTSLLAQRSVRLDIIVVDDASTDESASVVERFQGQVPGHMTLRLIHHAENQGAYAARNTGLTVARGAFITTHDSDDWSHPQKLWLQSQTLMNEPQTQACLSHWVRATPVLLFHRWRLDEYGWVYPNMSSLMFRREVRAALGFWDNVSVNADTEYRLRIEAAYGKASVQEVCPGLALSFGRADETSLSQHQRSHLASQYAGMRFDYMQAARHWHATAQTRYLPAAPAQRPFSAPEAMLRETSPANPASHGFEAVIQSGLFEPGWYLERYIDLQNVKHEPLRHFWEVGAFEGRDPGPNFSTTGFLRSLAEALPEGEHPLSHYLEHGVLDASLSRPVWPGARAFEQGPTVLLCAHQAGSTLFGAERSLLDVLDALGALGWNVVVTLPEAGNLAYEQAILARCQALAVLPYGWWQVGRVPVEATVAHFQALIERFGVSAVHGNTVVLQEPYVAARRAGVSTLVHVRELPEHDESLCALLGATPDEVVTHVHAHADVIIANSQHTARTFEAKSSRANAPPLCVVPNTLEMAPLLALSEKAPNPARTRVGMLSSNVAKKGLEDVEAMSRHLKALAPAVEVVLYGPLTRLIESLQKRQAQGRAPSNITYAGYVDTPAEALDELDIVVNLSRFQESFGRTVLEAMAAGKPVVAYRWGALGELIEHDTTGYLVAFAEPRAAAETVAHLSRSPQRCLQMGRAGRARALADYGPQTLTAALLQSYQMLGEW